MSPQGRTLLDELLAEPDAGRRLATLRRRSEDIDRDLIDALNALGVEAHRQGEGAGALTFPMIAVQAAQVAGDAPGESHALLLVGQLSAADGQAVMAREVLQSGYGRAAQVLADDPAHAPLLYSLCNELVKLSLEQDRGAGALRVLADARGRFHAAGAPSEELACTLNLAVLSVRTGDLERARDYAGTVRPLHAAAADAPAGGLPAPSLETVCSVLEQVADTLLGGGRDPEGAAELFQDLLALDPEVEDGRFRLGGAQMQAGLWDEAARTWQEVVDQDPDRSTAQANLAQALVATDRPQEGLKALDRAIALDDSDPRLFLMRGQTHQRLERHEPAVADFTVVLGQDDTGLEPVALRARALSLQRLGRTDEALADARALRDRGGDDGPMAAAVVEGDVLAMAGDHDGAAACFTRALEMVPGAVPFLLRRADALLAAGRVDQALEDLLFVGRRDRDPAGALARLEAFLERSPDHVDALLLRGFCLLQEVEPDRAEAELGRVLELRPDDARAHHWRGLARLTSRDEPDETGWNKGMGWDRIEGAMDDLAHARRLAPDDPDVRASYLWLMDRALGHPALGHRLRARADEPEGLFTLDPELRQAEEHYQRSFVLAGRREWSKAVPEILAAQHHYRAAGFELSGQRMHLHLADNRLRLWELQEALDDLDAAGEILWMHAMPVTPYLRERAEEIRRNARVRSGRAAATLELEYRDAYGIVAPLEREYMEMMRAQALSRLRRHADAVEALERVSDTLSDVEAALDRGISVRALAGAVQVYRDAGELDRALSLVQDLEANLDLAGDTETVLALAGTVYQALGQEDTAGTYYRRVQDSLKDDRTGARTANALQIAGNLIQEGAYDQALATLDAIDIEAEARSSWDRYIYFFHRGHALFRSGSFKQALEDIDEARSVAEDARATLHRYESRISWQASQEDLYAIAVTLAAGIGEPTRALELVEQAQSRAFVDQLAHGALPLPGPAAEMEETRQNLQRTRDVLLRLDRSVVERGPAYLDPDLLEALRQANPGVEVVEEDDQGTRSVSADRIRDALATVEQSAARLAREMEGARLAAARAAEGGVLGVDGIGALLEGGPGTAGSRVVLAEYFVTPWTTFLFVLEPGMDEPAVYPVGGGATALEADLAAFLAPRTGRPRFLDPDSRSVLAPLVAPLGAHLRDNDLVWIVPHNALHYVPLHLAPLNDAVLGVAHPVCQTPSASVMAYCVGRRAAPAERTVVFGDPLGDLPYARLEADEVADMFGTRAVLAGDATAARLADEVGQGPMDVLHLACHGDFDDQEPLRSGVRLAPDDDARARGESGVLTAEHLRELPMSVALVTLSACETGRIRRRGGDELVGLSRSVFNAGAAGLLVTLWKVDDLATSLLLRRFYGLWVHGPAGDEPAGAIRAQALRRAQAYVRDMTAADLVAYCDTRQEQLPSDPPRERWLRFQMARADAQLTAGDVAGAIQSCELLLERSQALGGSVGDAFAGDARRALSLMRLRHEFEPDPYIDYQRTPFADPYYWGAFVLMGDWN